ncbi:hypothetical protein [Seonamhaeicola sp.]|uniref:hypothetical protein n=1 Tax=Seonamhaeicola sp. TaxID=1912245 RepID=UPI0026261B00|nr:hypothetical protein [Seonamhaeicola sp.]
MAPIKFDEHIKDKLEKRRLHPSANAWDALSERLEADEKKKYKNVYWWYGIAAGIVGILFVISQFSNHGTEAVVEPQVVEMQDVIEDVELKEQEAEVVPEIQHPPEVLVSTQKRTVKTKVEKETPKQKNTPILKETPIMVAKNTGAPKEPETITEPTEVLKKELTFEEQKIQQVVAQVQELKEHKSHVTDAEIEALLQQAQKEIALKKLYDESTGIVDANALLQDVEADLDRSFRTKVFEALKASYGTVKSAVASRND